MSMPTRIDTELFEAARAVGAVQSRSAAQQLAHWARIGRELEASGSVSSAAVSRVLAGIDPYDELGDRDQAAVRAEWDSVIAERLASLDLAVEFADAGDTWTELDEAGRVVTRSSRSE